MLFVRNGSTHLIAISLLLLVMSAMLTSARATETLPHITNFFLEYSIDESDITLVGDVNGDGYSDIAVHPYDYVTVLYGSKDGLRISNSTELHGEEENESFAFAVSPAGDLNNDGFDDILIGAPDHGIHNSGKVYVFLGSSSGPQLSTGYSGYGTVADQRFGSFLSNAGDLNADGFDDVLIKSWETLTWEIWPGTSTGLGSTMIMEINLYGYSTAIPLGDFNADGYDDLYFRRTGAAAAFIGYGSAGYLNTTLYDIGLDDISDCSSIYPAGDVNGDGFSDFVLGDRSALFADHDARGVARLVSGHSTSYTYAWERYGDQSGYLELDSEYGEKIASAGDFNGDGFADFAVSNSEYRVGSENYHGLVEIFLGGINGPGDEPDYRILGNNLGDQIGETLICGGDINGDGFGDFIFTRRRAPYPSQGLSIVYGRGQTIAASNAARSFGLNSGDELGRCVSRAGDLNSDGFSDVAAGAYKYDSERGMVEVMEGGDGQFVNWTKTQLYGENQGDRFGYSVDYAGDVNGDGYSDLVVGAPNAGTLNKGLVYIYSGSSGGLSSSPAWILEADPDDDDFGFSVAGAGDANGDGFADVLVGDPSHDGSFNDQGRAALYLGSPDGPLASPAWAFSPGNLYDRAGYSVSFAGDTNLDGFSDLLIGSPGYDGGGNSSGRALVFHGSGSGPDTYPDWVYNGSTEGGNVGHSVACAGDINNDRYADILIGAPYQNYSYSNTGSAYLFMGTASGLNLNYTQRIDGEGNAAAYLGYSVDGLGDVNGDGYGDVVISEDGLDRVRVYLGDEDGLDLDSKSEISNSDVSRFGLSVSRAGDVNGDGFADLVVGGPYAGEFLPNRGSYYIHLGNGKSDVENTRPFCPRQGWPGQSGVDLLGKLQSTAGTPVSLQAYSPIGRGELRFQHRSNNMSYRLEYVSQISGTWVETSTHSDYGQYTAMSGNLPSVSSGERHHWQTRFETNSIYLPHSRWFSHPGTSHNMMHVRGAMDDPQPNLEITNMTPTTFAGAGNITVDFTVINTGNYGAGQSYCSLFVDGVGVVSNIAAGPLSAGETVIISADIGSLATGTRSIRIDLDVTGIVDESDETDNSRYFNINVTSLDYLLVRPDGTGDVATIADAVGSISAGGVVALADGEFKGDGNRDISISDKAFSLRSESGNPEACVIDAEGSLASPHRVFSLSNISSDDVQFNGITVRNGYSTYGGGMILNNASPRLLNCIIESCGGQAGGGVLAIANSEPVFENCRFLNNSTTDSGGAVVINGSDASFFACEFEGNYARYGGGAVYQYQGGGNYRYCLFNQNDCGSMGGAVHATQINSHMGFVNCTFYGNSAPTGGHLYSRVDATAGLLSCLLISSYQGEAFHSNNGGEITASCNDVIGNSGGNYVSGLQGLNGVNDNFFMWPGFCAPTEGNFHLESGAECADHAPCGLVGAFEEGCGLEYVVNPDGSGDFPTIQAAVDASGLNDVILLGNGTFLGDGNRDINIVNNTLTIRSQWGDSTACIVDCEGDEVNQRRGLILNNLSAGVKLENFTVTGGYTTTLSGAALSLTNSSPQINGMIFTDNYAVNGGAIYGGVGSAPWVDGCIFEDNHATNAGGAISLNASYGNYAHCRFEGNYARWGGGAIYIHASMPEVTYSLFVDNHCDYWGGAVHGSQPGTNATLKFNTYDGNSAADGAVIYLRENAVFNLAYSILTNSPQGEAVYVKTDGQLGFTACLDVYNNAGGDYVGGLLDVEGLPGFESVDPGYCDLEAGLYTLDSSSPCLASQTECSVDIGAFGEGCAMSGMEGSNIPDVLVLKGNYPNPFNPQTNIVFGLPLEQMVGLTIYNMSGQVVRRLLAGEIRTAGFHEVLWNGCDDRGRNVSSGVYFYRVQAGSLNQTGKMALIR